MLIYKVRKLQVDNLSVFIPIIYFVLKCICGIGLWIVYRDYFKNGDMLGYMKETETLYQLLLQSPLKLLQAIFGVSHLDLLKNVEHWNAYTYNPFFNDGRFFLIFNLLIRLISFGNVYAQIIWINFASFYGLLSLYNCFNDCSNSNVEKSNSSSKFNILKFIPFLLPSVLVFGSALLKESLLIFAFGIFIRRIQLLYSFYSRSNFILFIIAFILLLTIKPYLLLILLPGVIALFFVKKMPSVNYKWIFTCIYCGGLLELLLIGKYFPQFDLPIYLFGQRLNLMRNAIMSLAQTLINPVFFAPNPLSFIIHIPKSIFFAFTHPLPLELNQWWMFPISLDPIILFVLGVYLFIKRKSFKFFSSQLAMLLFFSSVTLLMILGFTIPVLGNLVRFKMPAMLMLALSLCDFKNTNEIKN